MLADVKPGFSRTLPNGTLVNWLQPSFDCNHRRFNATIVILTKCTLNFHFLIGILRFSSDSAFAWMPLALIHDKSLLPLLPYLRPRQNGRHFADGMLEYIFLIEIDIAFD